jgi:hypothetical protein
MNNVLANAFKENKFEELLVANWTHFIDSSKLMAYVLQNVQKNANNLAIISDAEMKPTGVKITVSRCYLKPEGFIIWVDFSIPMTRNDIADGTMELHMSHSGIISYITMLGNIYSAK